VSVLLGAACLAPFDQGGFVIFLLYLRFHMPNIPLASQFGTSTRHVVSGPPPVPVVSYPPVSSTITPIPAPSSCRDASHARLQSVVDRLKGGVFLSLEHHLPGFVNPMLTIIESTGNSRPFYWGSLPRRIFTNIRDKIIANYEAARDVPSPLLLSTVIEDGHFEGFLIALGAGTHSFHVSSSYPLEQAYLDEKGIFVKMHGSDFRCVSSRSRSRSTRRITVNFIRVDVSPPASAFSDATA
jgi:hypothetical protein